MFGNHEEKLAQVDTNLLFFHVPKPVEHEIPPIGSNLRNVEFRLLTIVPGFFVKLRSLYINAQQTAAWPTKEN